MTSSTTVSRSSSRPRKDIRLKAIGALLLLVALLVLLVNLTPGRESPVLEVITTEAPPIDTKHSGYRSFDRNYSVAQTHDDASEEAVKLPERLVDPQQDPKGHMHQASRQEAERRFGQAVVMLHAKRYSEAVVALDRFLRLAPDSSDGYVNLGYALLGLAAYPDAYLAFEQAIDLNPAQANAYYGAAIAQEGMGDLEAALGGMRSFLHLTDKKPGQIHVARARSAIWEWEARLGRGPWGPTKGIPPGFSAEELARDGRGVGIKMPRPETIDENGAMQYDIRSNEKTELFER